VTTQTRIRRLDPVELAAEWQRRAERLRPEFGLGHGWDDPLDPQTPYGAWLVASFRELLEWLGDRAVVTARGEVWVPDDPRCPDDVPA
jgi:hypothetical protein